MNKLIFPILFLFLANIAHAQRTVRTVYFDFAKDELTPAAIQTLNNLSDSFLSKFELKSLYLRGHCDSVGRGGFNDSLSQKRVYAAKEFFLNKGISDTCIKLAQGYGKNKPLNKNLSEAERQANRRVEVLVLYGKPLRKPVRKVVSADTAPIYEVIGKIDPSLLQVGCKLVLRNINFEGGRHFLLKSSYPALQELLKTLKDNPRLEIEILGYICCVPETDPDGEDFDTGKRNLSFARAESVYTYLIKNGIAPERLSYRGMGPSHKLTQERTEDEKIANRRVEIRVLKK